MMAMITAMVAMMAIIIMGRMATMWKTKASPAGLLLPDGWLVARHKLELGLGRLLRCLMSGYEDMPIWGNGNISGYQDTAIYEEVRLCVHGNLIIYIRERNDYTMSECWFNDIGDRNCQLQLGDGYSRALMPRIHIVVATNFEVLWFPGKGTS